jgi:transposase
MIRKDKKMFKTGPKTHIRVVEGYRDGQRKIKQRTIKSFGYLEEQSDQKAFMDKVIAYDNNFFLEKKDKKDSFKKPFNESLTNIPYTYGYKFIESIYDSLHIRDFFKTRYQKIEYDISDVLKFLIIERILNPDSKRATVQLKDSLFNFSSNFELHHVYRALDKFNEINIELQKYINDQIKNMVGRDSSYAYYDVTNYYTEIDFPNSEEDLRQRGVSKEHRLDPIIQLGLFMDQNGLPISMSLFKGNTADTKTLQPVMQEIKQHYQLNRLIVVADKGLNSTSNINYIVNNNDGYVVSQIIKGKKGQRYRNQLFDESSYIYNQDRSFKYKLFQEEYEGIDAQGKIVLRKRNVLIYWKLEDALMSIRKRDDKVNRALKSIGNNAYAIKHTYEEYIKETHLIEDTGEIADKLSKTLNQEKIENDAMYDGYFCIITSELDYDYKKIMEVYGGLWRIEESFRITKSNLEVRPIYVSKESRINGHFLICYVALIIIRMMQYKMHYSMSVERIVRALNTSKCLVEEGDIIKVLRNENRKNYQDDSTRLEDEDETINDYLKIMEAFHIDIPYERYKLANFNKYLSSIKYTI